MTQYTSHQLLASALEALQKTTSEDALTKDIQHHLIESAMGHQTKPTEQLPGDELIVLLRSTVAELHKINERNDLRVPRDIWVTIRDAVCWLRDEIKADDEIAAAFSPGGVNRIRQAIEWLDEHPPKE